MIARSRVAVLDPAIPERFLVLTRFPVPSKPALGQRLDGPHLFAEPYHMRLSPLEVNTRLRQQLLFSKWSAAVYGGRIVVRGEATGVDSNPFDGSRAICAAIADHLPSWAAAVRAAQDRVSRPATP